TQRNNGAQVRLPYTPTPPHPQPPPNTPTPPTPTKKPSCLVSVVLDQLVNVASPCLSTTLGIALNQPAHDSLLKRRFVFAFAGATRMTGAPTCRQARQARISAAAKLASVLGFLAAFVERVLAFAWPEWVARTPTRRETADA